MMPHVIEPASTGRSKCRGCDRSIAKGELRFGEREPNSFGEGEMTLWFHVPCAAYKRPETFLEAMPDERVQDSGKLAETAAAGVEHRRLPRLNGADRAPTGRARCRHCRELIELRSWRLALVFFEEFRFQPSGFIHAACAGDYFETTDVIERVRHFSPELDESELHEVMGVISADSVSR